MKALKEKRVSLRSLFRRSLVILSLLALAFASCSDSGGSDVTSSTPPGQGPGTTIPAKYVQSMTVLEHPYLPSYEGAYPDLTGLKVLVFWSDNTTDIVEEKDPKLSPFAVYPSVAYVTTPGTDETEFSTFNQYGIQYKNDVVYNPAGYKVNVYIPAVVAINGGTAGYATAEIAGALDKVFEDQDIEPYALELYADYNADPAAPTKLPVDYYSPNWGTDWPTGAAGVKAKRISANRDAWRISQDPAVKTAEYLLRTIPGATASDLYALPVKVTTFYFVENFELTGGDFSKIKIYADNGDFNVFPDPSTVTGHPNFNQAGPYGIAPGQASLISIGKKWFDELWKAGLTFKVTYYDPEAPNGFNGPTRSIGMAEYLRALNTTDKDGKPKATLPMAVGRVQPSPIVTGSPLIVSDVITSVYEDYPLSLNLFYYNRLIDGKKGEGYVDLKSFSDTTAGGGAGTIYNKPNLAVVPITDNNVIYIFTGIDKVRKDNTNNEKGEARAISNQDENYNKESVYKSLQDYWDVVYTYANEARSDTMPIPGAWITYARPSGSPLVDPIYSEFENEPVEGGPEDRTCVVKFNLPVSSKLAGEPDGEIDFPYVMLPY